MVRHKRFCTHIVTNRKPFRKGRLFVVFFNLLDGGGMVNNNEMPVVAYCAREQLPGANRHGPVIRRFFVVECNETGRGGLIINGKEYSFGPGQCYVLLPGDTVTQISDGEEPRGGIYCILDAPMLAPYFKAAGITSENPFIPTRLFPQVRQWLANMVEDFNCRDAGAPLRQAGNIYGLLGTLLQEKTAAAKTDAISKAIGIMEADYPESLSVEELSRALGLERTYFSSLFKEKTGYSPYRYLTALRIKKACLLLAETDLSVAEVAELVGLDARNFARLFKKEIGRTPLEYKKAPRVRRLSGKRPE